MADTPVAELAKKYAPVAIGAAAVAGSTGGVFPPWAANLVDRFGMLGVVILGIWYYIPRTAVRDFIDAQKAQAVALTSLADSVKNLPQKDHMKFEEILIGQEMLNRSLDRVHARLDDLAMKHDGKN